LGRILAVDYGKKRIGLAVTDPLQLIAVTLATVSPDEIFVFLEDYFSREKIDCMVIGYPRQMDNTESETVVYLKPFIKKLRRNFPDLDLQFFDERFTTKIAQQSLVEAGASRKVRRDKSIKDQISAVIILNSFLDYRKNIKANSLH
jgi:putative Holliday junction resolvase